jgi:hypothetical protein
MSSVFAPRPLPLSLCRALVYTSTSNSTSLPCIPGPSRLPYQAPRSRRISSTPCPRISNSSLTSTEGLKVPLYVAPRQLSDDPATLPLGYTFYPHHSDKPNTPPTMANIITSLHPSPLLPRSSVFQYLFPPDTKGKQTQWYPAPKPSTIAFIDGLTGQKVTREEVGVQAQWLAAGLKGLGLKKGDVGMTFGFNSVLYVNAVMGMQCMGVIVSPANAA